MIGKRPKRSSNSTLRMGAGRGFGRDGGRNSVAG